MNHTKYKIIFHKMSFIKSVCPNDVLKGILITKETRHKMFGKIAGGSRSILPEHYQRAKIIEGTGIECPKTLLRIHLRNHTLVQSVCPNKKEDGFDYSENFDGVQRIHDQTIYINLKCVVGRGGSQTRSLREVYWFIEGQINVLKQTATPSLYFANILDGDECAGQLNKFNYLLSLKDNLQYKNNIYIGDLEGYFPWFKERFSPQ